MKKKTDKSNIIRSAVSNYAGLSLSNLNPSHQDSEIENQEESNSNFPIGQQASFLYDVSNYRFTSIDPAIADMTGISPREILERDVSFFLSEIIVEDYLEPLTRMIQQSLHLSKMYRRESNLSLNVEFSIISRNKETKRLLCQYRAIKYNPDGYPLVNKGNFVDVTHLRPEGLPVFFLVANNKVMEFEQPTADFLIKNKKLPYTGKEMNLLKLTANGHNIKEIADKLNISISTVYTHRKNIKSLTNKDLFQIIQELRSKGII